jgi:peroxiredoxin
MKTLIYTLLLLTVATGLLRAQTVDYTLPEGFKDKIAAADYKYLVDISLPVVAKRYQVESVKNGTIILVKGQDMQSFALDNLIIQCARMTDRSQWKKIADDHFEQLFKAIAVQKKINPKDFESIKAYLSLRIYPRQTFATNGVLDQLVTRVDLEDTYTVLMLDLPGAFTPVQKADFYVWQKNIDSVFTVALHNVDKQPVEQTTKTFKFDKADVELTILGNEDYAASYTLDLAHNQPGLVGHWGSVIAVPNKGVVMICKISKEKPVEFVKFIQATRPVVQKYYKEHPQRISSQYFWYYNGVFTHINVLDYKKGQINVVAPVELSELISSGK